MDFKNDDREVVQSWLRKRKLIGYLKSGDDDSLAALIATVKKEAFSEGRREGLRIATTSCIIRAGQHAAQSLNLSDSEYYKEVQMSLLNIKAHEAEACANDIINAAKLAEKVSDK